MTHAASTDVGRSIPGAQAGDSPPAGGVWRGDRRLLTIGLVVVITLVAFESLAITTVMTAVARDLGGLTLYGWAFSAFFIGNLVGFVFAGLEADRHGPGRPFVIGAALFATGLIVGGLAPSMEVLIAGRAIQGFGGAAIPTVAYVAIARVYPEAIRPRMFAILTTAWVVPGIVGPGLAGVAAEVSTWRFVFLGLVPFVAIAGLFVARAIRTLGPIGAEAPALDSRRRLGAAVTVAAGATLLLSGSTIGSPIAGIGLAILGLAIGLPALRRLLPRGTLVAARGLPSVILARGISTFAFFGAEAFVPLMLVTIRGLSVAESGLLLTVATMTWTIGAWSQARVMERIGPSRIIGAGFACVAAGLAGVAAILDPAVPLAVGIGAWGVGGLGMGLLYSAITHLALIEAAPEEQGAASSSLNLSDVLGSALGTGVGGATIAYASLAGLHPALGLGAAFAVAIAVAACGVLVSTRLLPASGRGVTVEPAT